MNLLEILWLKSNNNISKHILKIEKILDKEIGKNKKTITYILKNNIKLQQEISEIINLLDLNDVYSCYNDKIISIITEKIKQNEDDTEIIERTEKKYSQILNNHIWQNINFICQSINRWILNFQSRIEHEKTIDNIKEQAKNDNSQKSQAILNRMNRNKKPNIYYDELSNLLDEDISPLILKAILNLIIKNIKPNVNNNIITLFKKTIKHRNMDKTILNMFLQIQTINSTEKNYTKIVWDDIDVNLFKKIIIKEWLIENRHIIPLTKLPYLELWNTIILSKYNNDQIINSFINQITMIKDQSEKITIRNFILNNILELPNLSENVLKEIWMLFDFDNEILKKIILHKNVTNEIRKILIFHPEK